MQEQIDWAVDLVFRHLVLVGGLSSVGLYLVLGRREELGRNAILNSVASLVVYFFNIMIVFRYYEAISVWMQTQFDAIGLWTLPAGTWDGVPLAVTVLVGIVTRDFCDYWNHRLMHTRWGWPAHAAHHSDTHVNAFTAFRVHAFESILMTASYVLLLTWLQIPETIPVIMLLLILLNMYVHLDLDIDHGPLRLLIASPRFHRWHHADTPEAYGKNLANVMPLWDWLFATYRRPDSIDAPMGLKESGISDINPVAILAYPVLQWGRMIRRRIRRVARRIAARPDAAAKWNAPAE